MSRMMPLMLFLTLAFLLLAGCFLAADQQFSCRWPSIFLLALAIFLLPLAIFLRLSIDIEGTICLVAILLTVI